MRLASGISLLAGLKELRRPEIGAMVTTKWEDEDLEWVRKHWLKLDFRYKFTF